MVLNFSMIEDNSGKDFDSKPVSWTPDGSHRQKLGLKTQHKQPISIVDNFLGLTEYHFKMKAFKSLDRNTLIQSISRGK